MFSRDGVFIRRRPGHQQSEQFGSAEIYLLSFEIMGHKVLLQLLVGVVDAQLLQVIDLKALEPVHI